MDIFEEATKFKFRFPSAKGELTTEQLWDLQLETTNANPVSLDSVARSIYSAIQSSQPSFVRPDSETRVVKDLEKKFAVVKRIIEVRLEQKKAAQQAADRTARRRALLEALANKEQEEISKKSRDDLLKELAEIDQ